MIPMLAVLRIERERRRALRLWLPLFLFWLLALPIAAVTLPVVAIVLLAYRRNPLRLFAAYWELLSAASGTHLEMQRRHASVYLHVY